MTIEKLNEIKKLEGVICVLEHRLASARAKAVSTTSSQWVRGIEKKPDGSAEGFSALRGMPSAPGISDKVGNGVADMDEIRRKLRTAKRRRGRLVAYIKGVEDDYMRNVLILKFIKGYTWNSIAILLKGGNTADGVRKSCERFLACREDREK